jgi:hypothetical protein
MKPAHRNIAFVAADLYLLTRVYRFAIIVQPYSHNGFATTVTHGLDFSEFIGESQQLLATLKKLTTKVSAQAVRQHRNVESVDDISELSDLIDAQELCFVHQDAVETALVHPITYHLQ